MKNLDEFQHKQLCGNSIKSFKACNFPFKTETRYGKRFGAKFLRALLDGKSQMKQKETHENSESPKQ